MQLTSEQEAIVQHPVGSHARILAVAGSGKTTTLVHRARRLILKENVPPSSILVLMFNRLAREQFKQKLGDVGLQLHLYPRVYTFHAFAFRFINSMVREGLIPRYTDLWVKERSELYRINVRRALENLERRRLIAPGTVGANEVMRAIGMWKGALIPPERAGYQGKEAVPLAYAEFEKLRAEKKALTFDDFVPMAIELIQKNEGVRERWCGRVDHLVVDEYQDVNHGQQQFVELLAGDRADVMVVGDDDQTIYEWRGARPGYIVEDFAKSFTEKPRLDYHLSRSFRFGPLLAQAAYNTIRFNEYRVQKDVVAHEVGKRTKITLYKAEHEGEVETTQEMLNEILLLVTAQRVSPRNIAVLARLYTQLAGIEIECLNRKVPYRVIGQEPFFNRQENLTLRHYVTLALALDEVVTMERIGQLLNVANKPSRYLPRRLLENALEGGRLYGMTLQQVLTQLARSAESALGPGQREETFNLLQFLLRIRERVSGDISLRAGALLQWLVDSLDYLAYFDDYYGRGETSFDRKESVTHFVNYAKLSGKGVMAFMVFLDGLDTTQREPPSQQLIMTSVHRTKGLEWDHVFLPRVAEGYMPYLQSDEVRIFDTAGIVEVAPRSSPLESERRLFYVAITRARNAIHIEVPWDGPDVNTPPSRFLEELQFEATREVVNGLQLTVSDGQANGDLLAGAMRRNGGYRHISRLLVEHYLQHIGQTELAAQIKEIAAREETRPFAYKRVYRDPEVRAPEGDGGPKLGDAWKFLAAEMEREMGRKGRRCQGLSVPERLGRRPGRDDQRQTADGSRSES